MRALLIACCCAALIACPGPKSEPDAGPELPADKAWGDGELPAGAEVVSREEFAALMQESGFTFITKAERDAKISADQQKLADAKALVDGLGLAPKSLATSAHATLRKDGNVDATLGDSTVMLQGNDWRYLDIADGLTSAHARENQLLDYASLYPLLADDLVVGLPTPEALKTATDLELETALDAVTRLADTSLSNLTPSKPGEMKLLKAFAGTGCSNHKDNNLYAKYDWPLKLVTTPVRDQGRRGSCVSFAITGALETRYSYATGVKTDYSEQELYGTAKAIWHPTSNSYGDGLSSGAVLGDLKVEDYRLDTETRWAYNTSPSRIDDEDHEKYTHSCDGYIGYCSNTNHQLKVVCSGNPTVCGYARPAAVLGDNADSIKLVSSISLGSSLSSIRAHLNAGHPVVIGVTADDEFMDASNEKPSDAYTHPGVVSLDGYGEDIGGHAILVVGYVSNGSLPYASNDPTPQGAGGGYLIVKNSWGCAGDGGYMYLSYGWVTEHMHSAHAVKAVSSTAVAGTGQIHADKSKIITASKVRVTLEANREVAKVELFRVTTTTTSVLVKNLPATQDETVVFTEDFASASQNNFYSYWAMFTDRFGNEVASNSVSVFVAIDNQNPAVALSVDAATVEAPGTVHLHANATDNNGIARVKFFHGLTEIGEDTTAPYALDHGVGLQDLGTTPYFAIAYDAAGNHKVSNVLQITVAWGLPPLVFGFTATPTSLPAGGGVVKLKWLAIHAQTVSISGVAVVSQGTLDVEVTQSRFFTLTATNPAGTVTRKIGIIVAQQPLDTTPPMVSLLAPASVTAPATLMLSAIASDDTAVTKVELLRAGAVIATDTDGSNGFGASLAVTAADVGMQTFTARAYDAAGNVGTSMPVSVNVMADPSAGCFVGPAGSDTSNDCRTEATPCRTLAYALGQSGGGQVTLLDGTYAPADQGAGAVLLSAGALVAKNPGQAVLGVPVRLTGGLLADVVIDRGAGAAAAVAAPTGTSSLRGVRWAGDFSSGPGLEVSGTAHVTLSAGTATNHGAATLAGTGPLFTVTDTAQLTLAGGSLYGPGVGSPNGAITVDGNATLTLDSFTLYPRDRGVKVGGMATLVLDSAIIEASTVTLPGSWGVGVENNPAGMAASSSATVLVLNQTRIAGFVAAGMNDEGCGIALVSPAATHQPRASVTVSGGSTLTQNGIGLHADAHATLMLRATQAHFDANVQGGIVTEAPVDAELSASTVNGNGSSPSATLVHWGGLFVTTPVTQVTSLKLRGTEVKGNAAAVSNAATRGNAGITLAGGRGSSFDLGRAAAPGQNTLTGNQVTGINTAAAGYVYAIGNVFMASTQGADAMGRYALGASPCAATACNVTTGTGLNYEVTNGFLRLAE